MFDFSKLINWDEVKKQGEELLGAAAKVAVDTVKETVQGMTAKPVEVVKLPPRNVVLDEAQIRELHPLFTSYSGYPKTVAELADLLTAQGVVVECEETGP